MQVAGWAPLRSLPQPQPPPPQAGPTGPRWDSPAAPPLRSLPPPRAPKPYFTGRQEQLQELRRWLQQPGAAQITGLEGGGGIGKSELARYLAHETHQAGGTVVWLERPEVDLRAAAAALIALAEPGFELRAQQTLEDLSARLRALLGPHRGLLVLDDVSDPRAVEALVPGGQWNVLYTTRRRDFLPGVVGLDLKPLAIEDALYVLSRVAYDADAPPPEEQDAARSLAGAVGGVPLALEIAGSTLRREALGCAEYLEQMKQGQGAAASDREQVERTLTRSLSAMGPEDVEVFRALGILPAAGAAVREIAIAVGESELQVARRVDRLVRHSLVEPAGPNGLYRLHPLLREAARRAAAADPACWARLHERIGDAMERH